MNYSYNTKGTCSRKIDFRIEDGKIYDISFEGGCPGNLKMISKILNGWEIEDVIDMCKGNICGMRNTSCADQLAQALIKVLESEKIGV